MRKYVFDLDNTLIYTDLLNNNSYNYALNELGLMPINNIKRITRDVVFDKYTKLNNIQRKKLIDLKQKYFNDNLNLTKPNNFLIELLQSKDNEDCLLWTSADKIRADKILEYYNIYNSFKDIKYSNKRNIEADIEEIYILFGSKLENLVFYENNMMIVKELQRSAVNVLTVY